MKDCKELILEFLNLYPKTTLILDALDECKKDTRRGLIETFDYLVTHASRLVKIFISSRPDGDVRERFKNLANIEIQARENHGDISKFVETEIMKHRKWNSMAPNLQREIVETLQAGSHGVFQWAYLQNAQLLDLSQAKDIKERLGKLPKGLEAAYSEIRYSMPDHERKIADRAFQRIMCSSRPLCTKRLLETVFQDEEDDGIKPVDDLTEDLLLECCHNLLVIDRNRNVWVPSHLSGIQYFGNHLWGQKQANCLVAMVCLTVLIDIDNELLDHDLEIDPRDASLSVLNFMQHTTG